MLFQDHEQIDKSGAQDHEEARFGCIDGLSDKVPLDVG